MHVTTAKKFLSTLAASMLLAGCGYAPLPVAPGNYDVGNSSRLVQQQAVPTLPKGVEARALHLEPATATARVGESLRFTVAITGSDGKTYTDGRLVSWSVSNPQIGAVDQNGILLPQLSGTVKVIARIGSLSAESAVQVDVARYAWQQMASPTTTDLHAVKMVTRTDAWAGGDHGVLLRYINGGWSKEPTFNVPNANIRGLGFANSNEGWAVGNRGANVPFISRWANGVWRTEKLPVTDGEINAISVIGPRDAWAVGQEGNGDALILHWDGTQWMSFAAPAKGKLNDIQMMGKDRGWAVGKFDGLATTPMILKFKDGQWVKSGLWNNRDTIQVGSTLELKAIKMVSETQGYAVGVRDPLLLNPRGLFVSYNPKRDGWEMGQYDTSVKNIDQVPLYDIEMISGTEGWALGETRTPDFTFTRNPQAIFGNLLANVGGVLKLDTNYFSGNLSGSFYAIDLLPQGEGFVVGQSGYILQRTYDWRNLTNQNNYGTPGGNNQNQPVTYGPGGQAVPVASPTPSVVLR